MRKHYILHSDIKVYMRKSHAYYKQLQWRTSLQFLYGYHMFSLNSFTIRHFSYFKFTVSFWSLLANFQIVCDLTTTQYSTPMARGLQSKTFRICDVNVLKALISAAVLRFGVRCCHICSMLLRIEQTSGQRIRINSGHPQNNTRV